MVSTLSYTVEGMSCQHCVNAITEEVIRVPGVDGVDVDLGGKAVTVRGGEVDDAAVRAALEEAGYTVVD